MAKKTTEKQRAHWRAYGPDKSIREAWTPDAALAKARDSYWSVFTSAFAVELLIDFSDSKAKSLAARESASCALSISVSLGDWIGASERLGGSSAKWEPAFKACVDDMCRGAVTGGIDEKLASANNRVTWAGNRGAGLDKCLKRLIQESWVREAFGSNGRDSLAIVSSSAELVDKSSEPAPMSWLCLRSIVTPTLKGGARLDLQTEKQAAERMAGAVFNGSAIISWVDPTKKREARPTRSELRAHTERQQLFVASEPEGPAQPPSRAKPRV